ncbi:MAG TPA: PCRF domain-containing protein, partial [Steroidobacteraceae bacterium]|nr:PCRF domain-containing protein [Steroidobacteraceae bacterium]
MKDSIRRKLEKLAERHEEVSHLLADPGVIADTNRFRELSMEYSRLDPVIARYRAYLELLSERTSAQEMAEGADNELRELGREELASLTARLEREEEELAKLLLPKDARDDSNIYLEVRA